MNDGASPKESMQRWLERGDPALDGREPGMEEIAAIRRAILAAPVAGSGPRPAGRRLWVAAAAALVIVAGAMFLVTRTREIEFPASGAVPERAVSVADAGPRHARRIQMTAPRGTRIIWHLDPDYSMEGGSRQ